MAASSRTTTPFLSNPPAMPRGFSNTSPNRSIRPKIACMRESSSGSRREAIPVRSTFSPISWAVSASRRDKIEAMEGKRPSYGILDITLYRDDLSTVGANPIVNRTELDEDVANKVVVLVDDVLYTGRTIRAALDQLMDFGRPRKVQLAVLIDRGREHRELPIQADFIGKTVPTKSSEIIKVMLKELDDVAAVGIFERPT